MILDNSAPASKSQSKTSLQKLLRLPAALAQPDITSLILRIAVAVPFWRSGILKWDGFLELAPIATLLFENEFKLHIFGNVIDYPYPGLAAFGAGVGEIVLPIMLVLGLFTRYAALGILIMTAIIQITIPTGWPLHLTWAAMAVAIMAIGPKRISIDRIIGWDR